MGRKARESTKTTKAIADHLTDLLQEKKAAGLGLREIAQKSGVASSSLSEWASDSATISLDNLVRLSRYFDTSTDYLLGLTDDPSRKPIAVDELGLSVDAVHQIQCNFSEEERAILCRIISSVEFWDVLREVQALQEQAQEITRAASHGISLKTDDRNQHVMSRVTKVELQLKKELYQFNAPVSILVDEKHVDFARYNIVKNMERIIQREIPLDDK